MCLSVFAHHDHPIYHLILLHNRDEFLERPTEAAHAWETEPILGGRDKQDGGAWLGVTAGGRWAVLSNIRDPSRRKETAPSRGQLVRGFLAGELKPETFLEEIEKTKDAYNGFNLVVGQGAECWYLSSLTPARKLAAGTYGLSNHLIDTPWPKLVRAKKAFRSAIGKPDFDLTLFALMRDTGPAPDADLPKTGIPVATERMLSPIFVRAPGYGTRTTTLLTVNRDGTIDLIERTYDGDPDKYLEHRCHVARKAD